MSSSERMIKRNYLVSTIERACNSRKYSLVIIKEKTFFTPGWYDFYAERGSVTTEILSQVARSKGFRPESMETPAIMAVGYFGDANALDCISTKMKQKGYEGHFILNDDLEHGFEWVNQG
ncbi:hypothetical protein WG901_23505 [Novosphingobium sp. PS1R-30]|uniref:Uncharacterized protein n=1 Tax=Novosphingobium anseongense TaxID=3133436 RepID=A0ABU8S3T5_9SPHN